MVEDIDWAEIEAKNRAKRMSNDDDEHLLDLAPPPAEEVDPFSSEFVDDMFDDIGSPIGGIGEDSLESKASEIILEDSIEKNKIKIPLPPQIAEESKVEEISSENLMPPPRELNNSFSEDLMSVSPAPLEDDSKVNSKSGSFSNLFERQKQATGSIDEKSNYTLDDLEKDLHENTFCEEAKAPDSNFDLNKETFSPSPLKKELVNEVPTKGSSIAKELNKNPQLTQDSFSIPEKTDEKLNQSNIYSEAKVPPPPNFENVATPSILKAEGNSVEPKSKTVAPLDPLETKKESHMEPSIVDSNSSNGSSVEEKRTEPMIIDSSSSDPLPVEEKPVEKTQAPFANEAKEEDNNNLSLRQSQFKNTPPVDLSAVQKQVHNIGNLENKKSIAAPSVRNQILSNVVQNKNKQNLENKSQGAIKNQILSPSPISQAKVKPEDLPAREQKPLVNSNNVKKEFLRQSTEDALREIAGNAYDARKSKILNENNKTAKQPAIKEAIQEEVIKKEIIPQIPQKVEEKKADVQNNFNPHNEYKESVGNGALFAKENITSAIPVKQDEPELSSWDQLEKKYGSITEEQVLKEKPKASWDQLERHWENLKAEDKAKNISKPILKDPNAFDPHAEYDKAIESESLFMKPENKPAIAKKIQIKESREEPKEFDPHAAYEKFKNNKN